MRKTSAAAVLGLFMVMATSRVRAQEFLWAKAMGGTGDDWTQCGVVDASGNVYTVGYFEGTSDFDPGPNTFALTSEGDVDAFISKLDSAGHFVWAKRLGGTRTDRAWGVAVGAHGDVYTVGEFEDTVDFDPGPGTYHLTPAGSMGAFVSKLDSSGQFVWAKQFDIPGSGQIRALAVSVDRNGDVLTVGEFSTTADFDPGPGTYNLSTSAPWFYWYDAFVSKLDGGGNFVWAKRLGGYLDDRANSVTVDAAGDVYTVGTFEDVADFDPSAETYELVSGYQGPNAFVSKLDSAGKFVWARRLGGDGDTEANDVAVGPDGNIVTVGDFGGTANFDPAPPHPPPQHYLTAVGSGDAFISELDSDGNYVWAGQLGGINPDLAAQVTVDHGGNIVTVGGFSGTADFDPGPGTSYLTASGIGDTFIAKLNADGSFAWAQRIGGSDDVQAHGVGFDAGHNLFIIGTFLYTADFDPGPGVYDLTSAGIRDAFVVKLSDPCTNDACCDDGNVCTDDAFDPAAGCVFTNNNDPCDDGNACTTSDVCGGGSCDAGTPTVCTASDQCHSPGTCDPVSGCSNPALPDGTTCDDGNPTTPGDACLAGICSGFGCPASPDPKTKGYYKKLCNNNYSGDSLTDTDAQCVASITATFSVISTVVDICNVLAPGGGDQCSKEDDQLMTLALNLCKNRLCTSEEIDSNCGSNSKTVGQSLAEMDAIFSDPNRDRFSCNHSGCLGEEINTGRALKLNSLSATFLGGTGKVRLNWTAPVLDVTAGTGSWE